MEETQQPQTEQEANANNVINVCSLLLEKTIPDLRAAVNKMHEKVPCKQFQLMVQDLDSIVIHLNDLKYNGPSEPYIDILLEDSETNEELPIFDGEDEENDATPGIEDKEPDHYQSEEPVGSNEA